MKVYYIFFYLKDIVLHYGFRLHYDCLTAQAPYVRRVYISENAPSALRTPCDSQEIVAILVEHYSLERFRLCTYFVRMTLEGLKTIVTLAKQQFVDNTIAVPI